MKVQVHLLSQSQPIERVVENAYIKEGMYCLLIPGSERSVEKYPMCNIFRVVESYK